MGITPLTLLCAIVGSLLLSFKRPIFGIIAYLIVYMCIDPWTWHSTLVRKVLLGRPAMTVSVIMVIACLVNAHQLSWKVSKREICIYAFIILAILISYFFGVGLHRLSFKYIDKLVKFSIFIFFFIRTTKNIQDYKLILSTFILCGFFLTYQAHMQTSFTDGRMDNVGGVDFHDANALSVLLIFCIVTLGFRLFNLEVWKKVVLAVPIAFMVNAFIMTQSRAAFLGLFFGFIFVLIRSPLEIKKELSIYGLLAVILFSIVAHESFWGRMGSIESSSTLLMEKPSLLDLNTEKTRTRIDFWRSSISIFKDYPMGIGIKNFEVVVPLYDPGNPGMDAHNTYVLCYSEIGVLGILLLLWILISGFFQLRRIKKLSFYSDKRGEIQILSLGLATFLIVYLTGPMVTHSYLYSEFTWILLSLPICLENAVKNEIISENSGNS